MLTPVTTGRAPRRQGRDHRGPRRRCHRGRQRPCPPARPGAGRGRPAGRRELTRMSLPELCIRRPVFATVLEPAPGPGRDRLLRAAAGARVPEHRPAGGLGGRPAIPGASPEIMETQVTQVLEASIAGIPGIDVLSSTSRQEIQPDHRPLHARHRPRGRRGRRARPGLARARPAARRGRRADHQQGRGRRRPDPLSRLHQRPHVLARHHRLRRPRRARPAAEPARRGRGPDPGRAPLRHAHLARPRPAGRLRPDRPGHRGRDPAPEPGGPGRADRERRSRVHRAVAHRA